MANGRTSSSLGALGDVFRYLPDNSPQRCYGILKGLVYAHDKCQEKFCWSGWTQGVHLTRLILQSELACPACGARSTEEMPTDACLYFYQCRNCGVLLRPLPGDCCVFCSYGTVKCPPIQEHDCCRTW